MISPPTDSLYKFIAIAGIVMVLWGAVFPWNKAQEYELLAAEFRTQIKVDAKEADILRVQYNLLVEQRTALDPDSVDFETERQAIINQKIKLRLQQVEAQKPADLGSQKLMILDQAQSTYTIIGWASMVIGSLFALIGFVSWYLKIQRYLDRDLAHSNNRDT